MLAVGVLCACRGYQPYAPAPLDGAAQAQTYSGRRLDAPGLATYLAAQGAPPPDSGLTPTSLALIALYFRSDIGEGHASVHAARAGEITAGARPFPTAAATVGRAWTPAEGASSPWAVSLTTGLTFETAGKRDARLERARALSLAAQLRLGAVAWRLANDARVAAVAVLAADHDLSDADAEVSALRTLLALLRARYAEGRVSLADVAQGESDLQTAAVVVAQVRRGRSDVLMELARSVGAPPRAFERFHLRDEPRSACGVGDSLATTGTAALLGPRALQQRNEVGSALADYAVSEADLRLQIAQQYPDVTIGPGIAWDQGIGRWALAVGSAAIPLNRNRGPIAEAAARRAERGAHVQVVEDGVLAGVDSAVVGCSALHGEIAATDSLAAATGAQLHLSEAAYARGEVGETDVAFARLAVVRATRTRNQALRRRQAAGAALEAALGRWVTVPGIAWPELLEKPAQRPPS